MNLNLRQEIMVSCYVNLFNIVQFVKEAPTALLKALLTDTQKIAEAELNNLIEERPQTESKLRGEITRVLMILVKFKD